MVHEVVAERCNLLIGGVIAAGAGIVRVPALFCTGCGFGIVMYEVVAQRGNNFLCNDYRIAYSSRQISRGCSPRQIGWCCKAAAGCIQNPLAVLAFGQPWRCTGRRNRGINHNVVSQRGDFPVRGIVTAGAGIVRIPAFFRTGRSFGIVVYEVVAEGRNVCYGHYLNTECRIAEHVRGIFRFSLLRTGRCFRYSPCCFYDFCLFNRSVCPADTLCRNKAAVIRPGIAGHTPFIVQFFNVGFSPGLHQERIVGEHCRIGRFTHFLKGCRFCNFAGSFSGFCFLMAVIPFADSFCRYAGEAGIPCIDGFIPVMAQHGCFRICGIVAA